ncbi:MAG: carboxypeptidase-like regulatory domain-containing protein, partial [Spirochaetaceae bacterium]|nr:carboxypeptidase-like regulatory domain-containing protein [Spirochaetaceae bacterium]
MKKSIYGFVMALALVSGFGFTGCDTLNGISSGAEDLAQGLVYSLSGTVKSVSGTPLVDAIVIAALPDDAAAAQGVTSVSGWYALRGLPAGDYDITVFATGYFSETVPATIGGSNGTLHFTMTPVTTPALIY